MYMLVRLQGTAECTSPSRMNHTHPNRRRLATTQTIDTSNSLVVHWDRQTHPGRQEFQAVVEHRLVVHQDRQVLQARLAHPGHQEFPAVVRPPVGRQDRLDLQDCLVLQVCQVAAIQDRLTVVVAVRT